MNTPRPWWFHVVRTAVLGVAVAAAIGLAALLTWLLGDFWGTVVALVVCVLVFATVEWWSERPRPRSADEPAPFDAPGEDR